MNSIWNLTGVPEEPGIYGFKAGSGARSYFVYVGLGSKIKTRVIQHVSCGPSRRVQPGGRVGAVQVHCVEPRSAASGRSSVTQGQAIAGFAGQIDSQV